MEEPTQCTNVKAGEWPSKQREESASQKTGGNAEETMKFAGEGKEPTKQGECTTATMEPMDRPQELKMELWQPASASVLVEFKTQARAATQPPEKAATDAQILCKNLFVSPHALLHVATRTAVA